MVRTAGSCVQFDSPASRLGGDGVQIESPDAAVRRLPRRGRLLIAPGCGLPTVLCDELGDAAGQFEDLEVYSGLLMRHVRFLDHVPRPFRLITTHVTSDTEQL